MSQGLLEGTVSEKCPLTPVTEEGMKEREVREGAQVALTAVLPCNVSFTRGQERTVHFAIVGLPEVQLISHALRISQKQHPFVPLTKTCRRAALITICMQHSHPTK